MKARMIAAGLALALSAGSTDAAPRILYEDAFGGWGGAVQYVGPALPGFRPGSPAVYFYTRDTYPDREGDELVLIRSETGSVRMVPRTDISAETISVALEYGDYVVVSRRLPHAPEVRVGEFHMVREVSGNSVTVCRPSVSDPSDLHCFPVIVDALLPMPAEAERARIERKRK